VEIGILAGLGTRTTNMENLSQKVQLVAQRGHGVIYFYWEGLWGTYAGKEGGPYRQATFAQLHKAHFGAGRGAVKAPFRPAPPTFRMPPPLPAATSGTTQPLRPPRNVWRRPQPPPPPPLPE
jgi:uncharacterized membrane protein